MITSAYIPLLALFLNHIMWTYIYTKYPRNSITSSYLFLTFAFSVTIFIQFIIYASPEQPWILSLYKYQAICWTLIGPLFFNMVLSILTIRKKTWFWIYLAFSVYIGGLLSCTDILLTDVTYHPWGISPQLTLPFIAAIVVSNIVPLLHSLYLIKRASNKTNYSTIKPLLIYIFWGSIICAALPLINDLLIPYFYPGKFWPNIEITSSIFQTGSIVFAARFGGLKTIGTENAAKFVFDNVDDYIFLLDEFGRIAQANKVAIDAFNICPNHMYTLKFSELLTSSEYEYEKVYTGERIEFSIKRIPVEFSVSQAPLKQWDTLLGKVIILHSVD